MPSSDKGLHSGASKLNLLPKSHVRPKKKRGEPLQVKRKRQHPRQTEAPRSDKNLWIWESTAADAGKESSVDEPRLYPDASEPYQERFYHDSTGTRPIDSKTIQCGVSIMNEESIKALESILKEEYVAANFKVQVSMHSRTLSNRIRKRLRSEPLPEVYIRCEDPLTLDIAEKTREVRAEMEALQDIIKSLTALRQKLEAESKAAVAKKHKLDTEWKLYRSHASAHSHPRLAHKLLPQRTSKLSENPPKRLKPAPPSTMQRLIESIAECLEY